MNAFCPHSRIESRCPDCEIARLRARVMELEIENGVLRRQNNGHVERIAAAHEVLAKIAERKTLPEAFKELREAGGHAWDNIDDPRAYLDKVCGE